MKDEKEGAGKFFNDGVLSVVRHFLNITIFGKTICNEKNYNLLACFMLRHY
jgi:hypothetical protein